MAEQPSRQRSLEQQRAAWAWKAIANVPDDTQDKYGSWARRLPALVQTNGLGATMAFLCAKAGGKAGSAQGLLYTHLSNWIVSYLRWENGDLMDLVRTGTIHLYRRATAEAIEYGLWLRRYVEGKDWGGQEDDGE